MLALQAAVEMEVFHALQACKLLVPLGLQNPYRLQTML